MLNISMLEGKIGIIKNKFSGDILNEWKDIFKKNTITKTNEGDSCWGIDIKCLSYNWFLKKVMPQITETFSKDTKLIFSNFMDIHNNIYTSRIHNDLFPLPEGKSGKPYLTILIPYSIDYKKENYNKIRTCFYNNNKQLVKCINWEENCLLWWDSNVLHTSSDFKKENIKSKQFFVFHTYV